jgi:hypothetical protein
MKPRKPTSGSWLGDAKALLEMGATAIDATTVKGLIHELTRLRPTGKWVDTLNGDEWTCDMYSEENKSTLFLRLSAPVKPNKMMWLKEVPDHWERKS